MVQVPKREPERIAALVNASLVLSLPVAFAIARWLGLVGDAPNRVTATRSSAAWHAFVNAVELGALVVLISSTRMLSEWR